MSNWLKKHFSKDHSKPPKGASKVGQSVPRSGAAREEAVSRVRSVASSNPWSVQSKVYSREDDDWENFFKKDETQHSDSDASDNSSGSQEAAVMDGRTRSTTPPPINRTRDATKDAVWRSTSNGYPDAHYGSRSEEKSTTKESSKNEEKSSKKKSSKNKGSKKAATDSDEEDVRARKERREKSKAKATNSDSSDDEPEKAPEPPREPGHWNKQQSGLGYYF